jgi:hypothetical protein
MGAASTMPLLRLTGRSRSCPTPKDVGLFDCRFADPIQTHCDASPNQLASRSRMTSGPEKSILAPRPITHAQETARHGK